MTLHARTPDIPLTEGPLLWSKVPEFSMTYVGASAVIPYVEYYLNNVMEKVRVEYCADKPELNQELSLFIEQENHHARYHHRYNKRLFEAIPELRMIADGIVSDLKAQAEKRSMAFNAAYCVGFESIATSDSVYLHEACDDMLEGADPDGANLMLWHVAEEFEHRAVCHDAFNAVSGNYFLRAGVTLYAFCHIGGAFMRAESAILAHFASQMSPAERKASYKRSRQLFIRHMRYLIPRALKVFLPWYDPARLPTPPRIQAALDRFKRSDPIRELVGRSAA